jgi:hypothetical protein
MDLIVQPKQIFSFNSGMLMMRQYAPNYRILRPSVGLIPLAVTINIDTPSEIASLDDRAISALGFRKRFSGGQIQNICQDG